MATCSVLNKTVCKNGSIVVLVSRNKVVVDLGKRVFLLLLFQKSSVSPALTESSEMNHKSTFDLKQNLKPNQNSVCTNTAKSFIH